jgi:hypothetical protein
VVLAVIVSLQRWQARRAASVPDYLAETVEDAG